jgi:hypothetical protein
MTILKLEVTTLDIALLVLVAWLFAASSKRTPPAESKVIPFGDSWRGEKTG